ncbi:MAG: DUF5666 domain-containing protein [Acidimicrobiales bacterium]
MSRGMWLVSVVLVAAVAGAAGVGIGWKLEQGRVKDDIKNIRPVGTVTSVDAESLSIELITADGARTYVVNDATVVESAASGDLADVTEGAVVLVKNRRNDAGDLVATEIIVLPESTTWGAGG